MSTPAEIAFNPSIDDGSAFITPYPAEDGGRPITQGGPVLAFSPYCYVHPYMLWNDIVESPRAFEKKGWRSCPPHLAAEARQIVFDDDFYNVDELWPDSAHLLSNRPSFRPDSLLRLSPAAQWVAKQLDWAGDKWPAPMHGYPAVSPGQSLADLADEEVFWQRARAHWLTTQLQSQLSVGDVAVLELVEAIASGSCDPFATSRRLLDFRASRHTPRGKEQVPKTAVARRAILDFEEIHGAVLLGQSQEIAAADIAGVSRNLLGMTPFWVPGSWRPRLVDLLRTLSS